MKGRDFQAEFERRLQLMDPALIIKEKLSSDTIFAFLNEAIDKFWKTRYSGINVKGIGFEQDQKRIDDLRTLIKKFDTTPTTESSKLYTVTLPSDYAIFLGDTAGISPIGTNDCWESVDGNYAVKQTDTLEGTIERIDRMLDNPLSEHHLKYCKARPIRLIENNKVLLYTDGDYEVSTYNMTYLKQPTKLSTSNISTEYTDLPEHTHIEIVKLAIQIYMATKPVQHYSAYSAEVNAME